MIEKYKIIKENNEEILCIYLDYNYEFGSVEFNKLKQEIKDNLSKIKFNGNKVRVIGSGLVLATLLLTNTNTSEIPKKEDYNYITNQIVEIMTKKPVIKKEVIKDKKVEKKEIKKNTTTGKKSTSQNQNINKSSNTNSKNKNNSQTTTKKTTPQTVTKNTNKAITSSKNTKQSSNQIIVTVYRSNGNVLKIELEEYLIGVVAGEMPASFSMEALKAQAVVARTYTLKSIQTKKKLTDTTSTQVYKDNNQLKNLWGSSYNTYYNKIKNAVNATKGITVKYNGTYIEALYHSTSNGYTENSENVFANAFPYLITVESSWDKNVAYYKKTITMKYTDILKKLNINDLNSEIEIISRNKSGRVSEVKVGDKVYTGAKFRMLLSLRSADFDIEKDGEIVKITTRGFGHGVGMSQYGANEMAKRGYNYKQIITHYYKGVSVK